MCVCVYCYIAMVCFQDILAHPVQPVLSTTSMVKGEEEVVTEESRLDQLVRSLSAAQWVSQTAVMMVSK